MFLENRGERQNKESVSGVTRIQYKEEGVSSKFKFAVAGKKERKNHFLCPHPLIIYESFLPKVNHHDYEVFVFFLFSLKASGSL